MGPNPEPRDPTRQSSPPLMTDDSVKAPSLLERLAQWLQHHEEPASRDELVSILHHALERQLLDADALGMMEGVLGVSDMQVRDVMIPRSQMDVIEIDQTPEQFIPFMIDTAHSRFPVVDEGKDNVLGILLAKDLLRHTAGHEFNVRDMLRPAVFVPESKRLNVLLREFRANRNHIAIVVDEYGGVAGLVTIEDVLEQIVGDIEDEYDFDETEDNIVPEAPGRFRVKAQTELADFNSALGTQWASTDFDTVGGLVLNRFGRMPKRGERILLDGLQFQVLRADSRRLHSLLVETLDHAPSSTP